MAVFTCPQCGHSQTVEDKHVGKHAACPKCKTQDTVRSDKKPFVVVPDTHVMDPHAEVLHRTEGPLGFRCESWVDCERHINKASSLRVESWTVIDDSLPIRFAAPCQLLVHNKANDYPLDLVYQASLGLTCVEESVTTFETRHMTFNVWGEHVSTLRFCEIGDLQPSTRVRLNPEWPLFSENEADEFCTSLSFVSRARLASGIVRVANMEFVLREAQRISEKVAEADLEQKAPKRY